MEKKVITKQLTCLKEINNHIKSQINYHAAEQNPIAPVHFQQIIPFVNRLMDSSEFKSIIPLLEPKDNKSFGQQLLNLFSGLGEVAKISNGYYLPLPERIIELPKSKKLIMVSSNQKQHNTTLTYLGLCKLIPQNNNHESESFLSIDEWMPSLGVGEFIEIINNAKFFNIDEENMEVFLPSRYRKWTTHVDEINAPKEFLSRIYDSNKKASYFWVKQSNKRLKYFRIPNDHLTIAKLSLENKYNIKRMITIRKLDERLVSLQFQQRIPRAEIRKLMLFAFPNNFHNPSEWIVDKDYLEDFCYVIEEIGLKLRDELNLRRVTR